MLKCLVLCLCYRLVFNKPNGLAKLLVERTCNLLHIKLIKCFTPHSLCALAYNKGKRHTGKAISGLQLMPGTQSLSLTHSLCLLQLLCLGGNPLRTRKNALWLQHREKPLQHFPYKHTYSIYIHMTSSCCCCCRALHISTSSLSLCPPLCLWQHDNNLSHFNHLAHQSCHTHISAAAALKEANEPSLELSYAKFL